MKNYNVTYYWTVQVQANDENEAQNEADKVAQGDILDINDLSTDIEEVK